MLDILYAKAVTFFVLFFFSSKGLRAGPKLTLEYQCATPSMFWPFKSDAVKRQPIAVDNLFYDRRELQAFEQGVNPTELVNAILFLFLFFFSMQCI